MKTVNFVCATVLLFLPLNFLMAQTPERSEKTINFPNIPGYKTLICDLHQHSVFSDALVWPTVRVYEALSDGLDAIAITDHIEYKPHNQDIIDTNNNRAFELALKAAEDKGIIVIHGAEITRKMPPGHANTLFIQDANKLVGLDSMAVFREAKKQGAFVIWNHPHWHAQNPLGTAVLTKMHLQLLKEGLIQGIEIVNEHSYSDEALKIAIDKKLTMIGASDIHGMIDQEYNRSEGDHRPVTLVFALEKTGGSIKEALIKGRTVVYFNNTLVGKQEFLVPLIQQSLIIKKTKILESYNGKSFIVSVLIENNSGADYIFENQKDYTFYNQADVITLKSKSTTNIQVKTLKELKTFTLRFKVLNALTAPGIHPIISINVYTAQN